MYDEFAAFLTSRIRERKETTRRLAEDTGIPEKALEQLSIGDPQNLPAAPYIHGYIVKLGERLDFDGEAWWQQLKRSAPLHSSGTADQMPRNRFSRNRIPGWLLWAVPLILVVATFVAFRITAILGLPDVAITTPDRDGVVYTSSPITLSGTATIDTRVTINDEVVPLSTDGYWEKEVTLQPGAQNDFVVTAEKFLGRSRSTSRRVFFEPPVVTTTTTSTVSTSTDTLEEVDPTTTLDTIDPTPDATVIEF